jgi:hypothetical protein
MMLSVSESDPSNSQGGNTDDLLAQLAGEEVDRLLAEAEVSQTPTPEIIDHVDEQEAAALTSMLEESAQKELEQIDRGEKPAAEAAPSDTPTAEAGAQEDVSSQLDQLFAALTTSKKEQEPEPPPPAAPVAPSRAETENAAVATEEKAALEEEVVQAQESSMPPENSLAWWVRPLEWINIPFASLSQKTKEKMGWIGVQTIIFALLILAYVWWLRGKK